MEGTTGGSILESTEELPVRVRLSAENRDRVNSITSLDLLSSHRLLRRKSGQTHSFRRKQSRFATLAQRAVRRKTQGNADQDTTEPAVTVGQNNLGNAVETVPLSSLGKVTLKPELAKITRYNGQRVNTVQGFLTPGVLPDRALSDFKQQLEDADWQLPNGYSYEFGGEAEQKDNALGGLVSTVGVIAVLMVATLVLSLGSFRLAAVIGVVAICEA